MSTVPSAAVTPTLPGPASGPVAPARFGPVAPAISPTQPAPPAPTTRYQTALGCLTLIAITVVSLGVLAVFVFIFGDVSV